MSSCLKNTSFARTTSALDAIPGPNSLENLQSWFSHKNTPTIWQSFFMQQPVSAHYMNRPLAALSLFSLLNRVEVILENIFYLSAYPLHC